MDMTGFGNIADIGLAGLAIIALIAVIEFAKKRYRESEAGDRRSNPTVVNCPNKIYELQPTLKELSQVIERQAEVSKAHVEATKSYGPAAQRIDAGVERLLEQVRPGARAEKVREESRDMLKEIVSGQITSANLLRELVDLSKKRNGR